MLKYTALPAIFIFLFCTNTFYSKAENMEIDFYGKKLQFEIATELPKIASGKISDAKVRNFTKELEKIPLSDLIISLDKYSKSLCLNDVGYYLMLYALAQKIYAKDANSSYGFIAYLLNKKGLDVIIGFTSSQLYLLSTTSRDLYETPYYQVKNKTYSILYHEKFRRIPPLNFYFFKENNNTKMEMDISVAPCFPPDIKSRDYAFNYKNKAYSGKLKYNMNLVDFYNDYPRIIIKSKFDAPMDSISKASIIENFKTICDEMGEIETINFLLALMHQSFEYKLDQKHFKEERNLFAEEFLHYSYSDCEDRSIFFAHLVHYLTTYSIVGVEYKNHIAVAVAINEKLNGTYYKLDKEKYYIADPSFIGGKFGDVMPEYKRQKSKFIKLDIN